MLTNLLLKSALRSRNSPSLSLRFSTRKTENLFGFQSMGIPKMPISLESSKVNPYIHSPLLTPRKFNNILPMNNAITLRPIRMYSSQDNRKTTKRQVDLFDVKEAVPFFVSGIVQGSIIIALMIGCLIGVGVTVGSVALYKFLNQMFKKKETDSTEQE